MKSSVDPKKYNHLKTESLLAELIANGISFEKIHVSFAGSFKKKFRKDIESVIDKTDDEEENSFEVTVNRDGLYDLFPEGLFHQPVFRSSSASLNDIIQDHRRLKEEEKNARKFFQPFENEILRYRTYVEEYERAFNNEILSGKMARGLTAFWDLSKNIPAGSAAALMRIFPWTYLIKGDLKLTAKVVELIIHKPVVAEEKIANEQYIEDELLSLNEMTLGLNLVAGKTFSEPSLCWIFTISDILANEMELYTNQNTMKQLLDFFTDIFVPVEIDVQFDYKTKDISEKNSEKILGFGFTL